MVTAYHHRRFGWSRITGSSPVSHIHFVVVHMKGGRERSQPLTAEQISNWKWGKLLVAFEVLHWTTIIMTQYTSNLVTSLQLWSWKSSSIPSQGLQKWSWDQNWSWVLQHCSFISARFPDVYQRIKYAFNTNHITKCLYSNFIEALYMLYKMFISTSRFSVSAVRQPNIFIFLWKDY